MKGTMPKKETKSTHKPSKPKPDPKVEAVVEAAKAVVEALPSNIDENHAALRSAVLDLPESD